jgi:hypothetical protein
MKRLTFDIPDELHRDIKVYLAPTRGKMKDFITDLIRKKLDCEQQLNEKNKTN